MLETQYNFNTAILVISFLGSKILCSIRIVPEVTIKSDAFEFAASTQL